MKKTNNSINEIIDNVIIKIKENKNELKKIEEIDKRYNNINIEVDNIIQYIENYRGKKIESRKENIIAIYRGNPYITIDLCIQAILYDCKVLLITEEVMYGVNAIITKIFQNILENLKMNKLITYKDCVENKSIIEKASKAHRVIVIGDAGRYQYLRKNIKNIEFKPYNNIAIYIDNEKFEGIVEKMCEYAEEYEDDIEVYRQNIEDIEKDIFIEKVLLLTEDENIIKKAKEKLITKKIIINKNPLEKLVNKYYI